VAYQTPYYPPISGTNRGNKKVEESLQKKELPKREKHMAIITDPNTGKNLNLEELAPKVVSKNQTIITATNDSNSEAINSEVFFLKNFIQTTFFLIISIFYFNSRLQSLTNDWWLIVT
jgi:hypothetical protein